ncbi:MAG: hypothetical protein KBD01_03310 [Acidobacteria bacterium]|nr:hypothetical protein [Acidobacteriota bacterium]
MSEAARWRWLLLFGAAGALALAAQVYLLRELMVTLQADELALGIGFAAWLGGIAFGASAARATVAAGSSRLPALGLAGLVIATCGGVLAARLARGLIGTPGELLPLGAELALAILVLGLPGAMVGSTFAALAGRAAAAGWGAGDAIPVLYVGEALGSLAAGALVTFVTIPLLPPLAGLALALAVGVAAVVPAALARAIAGGRSWVGLAVALALAAVPAITAGPELATQRARFAALAPGLPLLAWDDTPYQHVAIAGDAELRHLYEGGQYAASFPDPAEAETRAHVLASLAAMPRRVLALGDVVTGSLRHLLRHPVESVEIVRLDRREFSLLRERLAPEDRAALADPRVRIVFADPRRHLATSRASYDLLLVLQPDPVTLLLARTATAEFFQLAASRLDRQGVLVMRFGAAATVQSGATALLGGSLYRSLREAFPVVRAAPGPDGLFVAGFDTSAATLDPAVLAGRFRARGLASEVFAPELFPLLLPPERVAALDAELRRAAREVEPARDERPVSFLHALTVRQQVARSAVAPLIGCARRHPVLVAAALLAGAALPLLVSGWRRRRDAAAAERSAALGATLVTGACGMAWSLLVLFGFQTRAGALYGELGALTATFMLGLAGGGAWSWRRCRGAGGLARAAALATLAAGLLAALLPAVLALPFAAPGLVAAAIGLLLLVAGFATGAIFPAAASVVSTTAGAGHAAARIEAADHAGAMIAALFVAVLLLPLFGIARLGWLLAVAQLLALAAVANASRRAFFR